MFEKPNFYDKKENKESNEFMIKKEEIIWETKKQIEDLGEEVLDKRVEKVDKILKDTSREENISFILESFNINNDYFSVNISELPWKIEEFYKNFKNIIKEKSKNIDIKNYDFKLKINELKIIFKWKNNEILQILEKNNFSQEDIFSIFLIENLYFYFSTYERLINILPEDKRKELEKNPWKIIQLFEKEWIKIFFESKEAFKVDKDFKKYDINIKDFLPSDKYTSEILKKLDEKKKNWKINFLKEKKEGFLYWTVKDWEILVFRKNIKKNYPNASETEIDLFEKWVIKNEIMHYFLKNIWFSSDIEKNDIGSFYDIYSWKEIELNNLYIHEILSDYSTFSSKEISKLSFERIIWVTLAYDSIKSIWKDLAKEESYFYTRDFHKNIIEKALWKNINTYEKYKKFYSEHIKNFEKNSKWINVEDKLFEIYNNEISNFFEEVNKSWLITDIYEDLKKKQINYDWKNINWLEYLKIMNQKQWKIIMNKIYNWHKQKN